MFLIFAAEAVAGILGFLYRDKVSNDDRFSRKLNSKTENCELFCARFSECRYAAKTKSGENNLDARDLGMEAAVEKKNGVFAIPAHYYPGAWNTLFVPQRGL